MMIASKIRQNGRELLLVILLIGMAYSFRILYPDLYMKGSDLPGHVLASMRLHQTSPLGSDPILSNFFFQIFAFNHGYTTILLPWTLYEVAFGLFDLPITESRLVYINNILGIFSLLAIYYFARVHFGTRVALLTLLLVSFIPAHVGVSRAHVGLQIVYLTFFYLSLAFLKQYLDENRPLWRNLYYLTTLLYIGSDNAFFAGLFLHLVYLFIMLDCPSVESTMKQINTLYLNPTAVISLFTPILIYIALTTIYLLVGIDGGYLLRLFSKTDSLSLNPFKVLWWMLELLGPITLAFLISLPVFAFQSNRSRKPAAWFLLSVVAVYFVLFTFSSSVERNYVLFLMVPVVLLAVTVLEKYRLAWVALITPFTLLYTASIVYDLKIGFSTTHNYGSVSYLEGDNDDGVKTLGYLIRTDEIEVSKGDTEMEPVSLFIDYEGAAYYLGANYVDLAYKDIENESFETYGDFVLAYQTGSEGVENAKIKRVVERLNLNLIGSLCRGDEVLIELYANQTPDPNRPACYQLADSNEKFDIEFGNLDDLPRIWLGHF